MKFGMRRARVIALLAVAAAAGLPAAAQQDRYVDDDACPGPGTGTQGDPYCKIQDAICELKDIPSGGTVHVLPGTYLEAIRFWPDIQVISTDGRAVTTIDATGSPCVTSTCTPSTTLLHCSVAYFPSTTFNNRLEGFRITGGGGINQTCGGGGCNIQSGGGIFILSSSPVITNNEIVGNVLQGTPKSYYGGGIYVHGGNPAAPPQPVITQNLIEGNVNNAPQGQNPNNHSLSAGGGIYVGYNAAPIIEKNIIRNNIAGNETVSNQDASGGGIAVFTDVSVAAAPVISKNVIEGNYSRQYAGGIMVDYANLPTPLAGTEFLVEDNVITGNTAGNGGGAFGRWTRVKFRNNTFVGNEVTGAGAALYLANTENPADQVTLANNLMVGNLAGPSFSGGGLYVASAAPAVEPVVGHNDLHGNTPGNVGGTKTDGDYIGSNGNISADPMFVSPTNLRLQSASPAIESGDNSEAPAEDMDSTPRPQDANWDSLAVVDMGAYEFPPDFDGDASPDWQDLDDDEDGVLDTVDCADFVRGVSAVPGEVPTTLRLNPSGGGATRLRWDRGTQGHTSNVYRGTIDPLMAFSYNDSCVFDEKTDRTLLDSATPPVDNAFYYLVSARNVCGESGASGGMPPTAPCTTAGRESDGDGLPDLADNCAEAQNAPQVDGDGDWVGDACDNCSAASNPTQADDDEDLAGNLCDCAPDNAAYQSSMPEVTGLQVSAGSTFNWGGLGGGAQYDVAGGLISELILNQGFSTAACIQSDVPTPAWQDSRPEPPTDDGYYYLVRAKAAACRGGWGKDSGGADRVLPAVCP